MESAQLFLGFSLTPSLERALQTANPAFVKLFISKEVGCPTDYLHLAVHEGRQYLGKLLGPYAPLLQFELSAANLYSVAQKVIPKIHSSKPPLVLLTLIWNSKH
jgi:hypothetical protein